MMKSKFLKLIVTAFVLAMVFGVANNRSTDIHNTSTFLSSDNIVFADGYTCRPQANYNCRIPGNIVVSYVADYTNSEEDDPQK